MSRVKGIKKGYIVITMLNTAEEVMSMTNLTAPELLDAICEGSPVNSNQRVGIVGGLSTPELGKLFEISHEMVHRILEKGKDKLYTDRTIRAAHRQQS